MSRRRSGHLGKPIEDCRGDFSGMKSIKGLPIVCVWLGLEGGEIGAQLKQGTALGNSVRGRCLL